MNTLRVTESDTALKFAPFYLANDLGFFEDEGLEVSCDVDAGPGGSWLVDNLLGAKADIALGGIWLPLMYSQLGIGKLQPFAALCHRHPNVLLGRKPIEQPFSWDMVYGKKVLMPLAVTSQWMFLQGRLKQLGVDVNKIQFVRDLHLVTTHNLWKSGFGDFYLLEPLLAEILADEGFHIVSALAETAESVPWSVFYARTEFISENSTAIGRFKAAIEKANRWILVSSAEEVVDRLANRFTHGQRQHITRVINRLISTRVWHESTDIDSHATAEYEDIMISYGLIEHREYHAA